MTDQVTDTHNPVPATEPLALRLSEGLGPLSPERATVAALRKCAEWLSYCLSIGWRREQLDALEALWWQHHDRTGRLV